MVTTKASEAPEREFSTVGGAKQLQALAVRLGAKDLAALDEIVHLVGRNRLAPLQDRKAQLRRKDQLVLLKQAAPRVRKDGKGHILLQLDGERGARKLAVLGLGEVEVKDGLACVVERRRRSKRRIGDEEGDDDGPG